MAFRQLLSAPVLSPGGALTLHRAVFCQLGRTHRRANSTGSSLQQLTQGDRKENIDKGARTHISSRYDKRSLS